MTTVLLDDSLSSAKRPSSLLFKDPLHCWRVLKAEDIESALAEIEQARAQGHYVVALFSYELGELLQGVRSKDELETTTPFIEAYSFANGERLSAERVSEWVHSQVSKLAPEQQISGLLGLHANLSEQDYAGDIAEIQRYIAQGDTYQVNHTFRLKGQLFGHPLALYQTLRARQPVRYGAYIETGSRTALCFSPELFIKNEGGVITAKPMKGTLSSTVGSAQDLASNEKDRAENLMITDLIRNDLGRICATGSIAVPKLFEVEEVGSVYQMTSTITGQLRKDLSLAEILKASFPCGSVTGAPKKRTMEIIRALERAPRNLYCGSIACFEPNGDFQMNVVIRTLEIDSHGRCEMGVGSGITIDSNAKQEWQECSAKARFVTELPSPVGLIETMRCENGEVALLAAHLNRMEASAAALRISFDRTAVEQQIAAYLAQRVVMGSPETESAIFILRLELSPSGELQITHKPIESISGPQKIFWAKDLIGAQASVMHSTNPLLAHKVTLRAAYDSAWQTAVAKGGFDAVFTNERGEITEGGRSTLFALIDNIWVTPPLGCGVLPGVMREKLFADLKAQERVLMPEDLAHAKRVVVVNALRGVIDATLTSAA
jgi:para-aminobenzoate synthetase / 4-amino-4-deoxychorismate lyase